jgi:alpha-L-fucosidase
MADGVIPERSAESLREVGRWLRTNGEAVYGAGRTPFGEELGGHLEGVKDRSGKPVFAPREQWRCTTKPGRLYFTVFRWPREAFDLPTFKNRVRSAWLLSDPERKPLPIATAADGVVQIEVSRPEPTPITNVIVVDHEGDRIER